MITIETNAVVSKEGELTVHVNVPAEILPGEHSVVLVISESRTPEPNGEFVVHKSGLASLANTLRREDLYGDDGR